jgi:hypothetical protein
VSDKTREVQGYIVKHAIWLGGGEVIFAEHKDKTNPNRYMVCNCDWSNPLGGPVYSNAVGSADFLELMKEFTRRISERIVAIETERELRGIPRQTLTAKDCNPIKNVNLEGQVVVIDPEVLAAECRNIDYQLALCTGGFGANPNSRGQAVFCTNLITGQSSQWSRSDIVGIMPIAQLPDWAEVNLTALQKSTERESARAKLKEARKNPNSSKLKQKKRTNDGPEL